MNKIVLLAALVASPQIAFAEEDKKTARTWKAKCSSCHGAEGNGQTEQGKKMAIGDMTTAAWQKERTDDKLKDAINNGIKREKDGKKQEMDAFGKELKADQVDALVKFIRSLEKK
jgi:mono/diheme cytochrome c family protein